MECPGERHEHQGRGERTANREARICWLLDVVPSVADWENVVAVNQLRLLQVRAV